MLAMMRRLSRPLGLAAATTLVLLAGCASEGGDHVPPGCGYPCDHSAAIARNGAFALAGTLTIKGPYWTGGYAMTTGSPCTGISNDGVNYEEVKHGSPLTVLDNTGATAGTGVLEGGKITKVDLTSRECVFEISVSAIVAGKGFYSLTIGGHTTTDRMSEADFRAGPSFILAGSDQPPP